jgi:hypothetical protein
MAKEKGEDPFKHLNGSSNDTEGAEGTGTSGGQGGQIEFRDFIGTGAGSREDLLAPQDKLHLLSMHKEVHETRVKKQKALREARLAVKQGKVSVDSYRQGLASAGTNAQYKANPILANKAQFSGIDRQVNALPNENVAETNPEQRYQLSNRMENTPRFHPKPQYR